VQEGGLICQFPLGDTLKDPSFADDDDGNRPSSVVECNDLLDYRSATGNADFDDEIRFL
jgi:hypothetical protein